jgi:hypothetical protein
MATEGEGMNFRDNSGESVDGKYLSKRVMINGQFVTLYSANGQTWVSSPEDLPALMDRLENARVSLTPGEKVAEGEPAAAPVKPEVVEEEKPVVQKALQTKYRMKGPKPRPILRQGGVVIKGTPVEPISASNTSLSFSSDVDDEEDSNPKSREAKTGAKARAVKDLPQPIGAPKSAKSKQVSPHKKMIAPVLRKPVAAKAAVAKQASSKSKPPLRAEKVQVKQSAKGTPKTLTKDQVALKAKAAKKLELKKAVEPKKAQPQAKKAAASPKKVAARPAKKGVEKKSAKKGKASRR